MTSLERLKYNIFSYNTSLVSTKKVDTSEIKIQIAKFTIVFLELFGYFCSEFN